PKKIANPAILAEPFLAELESAAAPLARGRSTILKTAAANLLGTVIASQAGSLGWLVLADKESRGGDLPFTSEDGRFLSSLAALCGVAIEKRRHVARLERERQRLEEENRRLRDASGRAAADLFLVGESPAMKRVIDLIGRVAASSVSVLITGESGTGKELVARLIHEKSPRRQRPFVAINCAALPESLLEAELFGIEKGVATGVEARAGKFEQAQGGTIFLDEISDMPLALQAKILRVLQERESERVGGRRKVAFDVRVLSATHQDLSRMIAERKFREDLYYRLRVVEIDLPPLRARREDLPRLVRYFLGRFAAREGTPAPSIDRGAMRALMAHPFRGNVRELENLLEGAAALATGGTIRREDLQWIDASADDAAGGTAEGEPVSLRQLEIRNIQRALQITGGKKVEAARILGIHRTTLYRRRKK
ncbi:MAG TPA: sigma-54 dependent transcriptional regulator, partial [Thermoanaerobaculia bacterium]|nr:sigma-54 dependent transcriptional regulator [Thermoanaerobaculia bacterium]